MDNGEVAVPCPSRNLKANQPDDLMGRGRGSDELMDRSRDADGAIPQFGATVGNHGVCILPEDFPENDGINPCTFVPETYETPTFDYYDYMEFNRLRMLLFHVDNRKNDFLNRVDRKIRDPENVPSDAFLRSHFQKCYGAVDLESKQILGGLEVLKEYLIEQADMDPEDPEIMLQLLDLDIEANDPILAWEELRAWINRLYDDEKIKLYTTLDPRHASAEWFVISRGHPGIVRERHLRQDNEHMDQDQDETLPGPEEEMTSGPLQNLHIYDPKFELCFDWPYRVLTEDYGDWEIYKDIPRLLAVKILTHLNKFPCGVTPMAFWESYLKDDGTRPRAGDMTLMQILNQFRKEIWFVKPRTDLPELIFPGFLENVVDPDIVLKRAWHTINCLLGMNSFMLVDDVFATLKTLYSFKFHPNDWEFTNVQSFIQYCNRNFASMGLTVYRVIVTKGGKVCHYDYLLIDSNHWKRHVEKLHGIHDGNLPTAKPVPKNFLELGDSIDALSNYLNPTEYIICGLTFMTEPYDMYVVPREFGRRLDHFMVKMQRHEDVIRATSFRPPHFDSILLGMYVLAFVKREYEDLRRWHRALVIRKKKNGSSFCVYSIDYGFLANDVEPKDIRLMPRGVISKELAYAIPMRLKLIHPDRKVKIKHREETTDMIYDVIGREVLQVKLLSCKFKRGLGCRKWKVDCHVVTRFPEQMVMIPDLAHLFYKEYAEFKQKLYRKRIRNNRIAAAKAATLKANSEVQAAEGPSENDTTKKEIADLPTKSAIPEVKVAEVTIGKAIREVNAAGETASESNSAKTDDDANHVAEVGFIKKRDANKDGNKMAFLIVAGMESEEASDLD
ncbi:unnamed protein product [Orchesella dallaii]|uniref:Tudor domain-containing protein n=1 Tax=Orchesella dallaii TaxID=48710 RepID=A0ABP1RMT8_9HEXA